MLAFPKEIWREIWNHQPVEATNPRIRRHPA